MGSLRITEMAVFTALFTAEMKRGSKRGGINGDGIIDKNVIVITRGVAARQL